MTSDDHLYLYSWVDLSVQDGTSYRVVAANKISSILAELQTETGLRYFLVDGNQVIHLSDLSIHVNSALLDTMLQKADQSEQLSLDIVPCQSINIATLLQSWNLTLPSALT